MYNCRQAALLETIYASDEDCKDVNRTCRPPSVTTVTRIILHYIELVSVKQTQLNLYIPDTRLRQDL